MDFISNQAPQIEEMLKVLGIKEIDELFAAIPEGLRHSRPAEDDGMSEFEGMCHMEAIASKNTFSSFENYLGAGAYEHHVPVLVAAVCSKSEFLTSYTPYQAEASQGMLQIIFEFQSAICALTGMDVSNASLYDGASACAEALLMALRVKSGRNKVIVAQSLHPHYRSVIEQYLASLEVEIETIPYLPDGSLDQQRLQDLLDQQTAGVLIQSPNFFGMMEEVKTVRAFSERVGALTILCANPLSYGIYASASELGADIAVGDGQPFGLPLQFGGPYVGYIACKEELVRQLPGRIVGETLDTKGRRGFVLTLQAREQHIRREKATSNVCTNQALAALACLVSILWYGKKGIPKLAATNFRRAAYLRQQISRIQGVRLMGGEAIFNEFVYSTAIPTDKLFAHFRSKGIEPGLDLGRYYSELNQHVLVAVTETKSKSQLDAYAQILAELNAVHSS